MRKLAVAAAALIAIAGVTTLASVAYARSATRAPQLDDATIVAIFDAANSADIETGALGAERGQSKEVREFGRMLADVHTAVRQKGRDLAGKLGVTPTAPKDDHSAVDHAAVMKKLRGLSGAAFDRAFLEHERAFHAAVLSALNTTLIPAIQNKELKDFVVSLVPAFEAHRLQAENLGKKVAAN
jgi:putative membrane protein